MGIAIRVYNLARLYQVENQQILDLCHRLGFDVRYAVSSLTTAQRKAIEKLIKREGPDEGGAAVLARLRPSPPSGSHHA